MFLHLFKRYNFNFQGLIKGQHYLTLISLKIRTPSCVMRKDNKPLLLLLINSDLIISIVFCRFIMAYMKHET